jgi:hypothetical protein
MQRLFVAILIGALVSPLVALAGCGGGGGAGMGDPDEARLILTNVITAGHENNFAKARPNLDVVEWLTAVQDPNAATYSSATPEEQEELAQRFFGTVKQVTEFANLPDAAAIHATVGAATMDSNPQLKVVILRFSAPDREKPDRMIEVTAKMRYGMDGTWRLANLTTDW